MQEETLFTCIIFITHFMTGWIIVMSGSFLCLSKSYQCIPVILVCRILSVEKGWDIIVPCVNKKPQTQY